MLLSCQNERRKDGMIEIYPHGTEVMLGAFPGKIVATSIRDKNVTYAIAWQNGTDVKETWHHECEFQVMGHLKTSQIGFKSK